tara:strand:- start:12 stop:590 length:579 start_codon:yes stop_codon:yes gene_type:complete
MCPKSVVNFVSDTVKTVTKTVNKAVTPVISAVDDAVDYTAEKVENTVKDVSGITAKEKKAKEEYKKKQAEADRMAKEKQAELDRLAREREAVVAQQQATLKAQELRLVEQRDAQGELVAGLQADQETRISEARARGNAVTNSLRILAQKSNKAPTAQTSKKKGRTPRPRSTTAGLRLGGGRSGSGAGTNYSV